VEAFLTRQDRSLAEMRMRLHVQSLQRRLSPAARARALAETLRFADPLAGVDWATTDVEDLLALVLSEGFAIEAQMTEDLLKQMEEERRRKEQLRALATPGKHEARPGKHRPPGA